MHYDVELSREEWIKLVTWIDCGAPYYGSYYGRRNLAYRGQPDFRPVPTLESACGVPPEFAEPVTADQLFNSGGVVTEGGEVPAERSVSGGFFGVGGKEVS